MTDPTKTDAKAVKTLRVTRERVRTMTVKTGVNTGRWIIRGSEEPGGGPVSRGP
jgi:hypothetical protein